MGCQVEVHVKQLMPAVFNEETISLKIQQTAKAVLPNSVLDSSGFTTMAAEDMAFMQEKVPGCYFFIGSNDSSRLLDYGHHHPKFDFDEEALVHGVALMASAASDILK
jgi:amidohydrolase